jgi:Staphylococcal nuclease homologue
MPSSLTIQDTASPLIGETVPAGVNVGFRSHASLMATPCSAATGKRCASSAWTRPETKHPQTPVQPFGKEASACTKQLAEGQEVRLEFDVQWRDTYRRLLAYVYIRDTILNAELVRQGSAQVATFPPKMKDQELFLKLQRAAREAKRALWTQ